MSNHPGPAATLAGKYSDMRGEHLAMRRRTLGEAPANPLTCAGEPLARRRRTP